MNKKINKKKTLAHLLVMDAVIFVLLIASICIPLINVKTALSTNDLEDSDFDRDDMTTVAVFSLAEYWLVKGEVQVGESKDEVYDLTYKEIYDFSKDLNIIFFVTSLCVIALWIVRKYSQRYKAFSSMCREFGKISALKRVSNISFFIAYIPAIYTLFYLILPKIIAPKKEAYIIETSIIGVLIYVAIMLTCLKLSFSQSNTVVKGYKSQQMDYMFGLGTADQLSNSYTIKTIFITLILFAGMWILFSMCNFLPLGDLL